VGLNPFEAKFSEMKKEIAELKRNILKKPDTGTSTPQPTHLGSDPPIRVRSNAFLVKIGGNYQRECPNQSGSDTAKSDRSQSPIARRATNIKSEN
jgi:hypothetical protein